MLFCNYQDFVYKQTRTSNVHISLMREDIKRLYNV